MARSNETEGKTEFARYLRTKRSQTVTQIEGKYRNKGWRMSQAEFCHFINQHIEGRPLSVSGYIRMENGGNVRESNQKRIRAALDNISLQQLDIKPA